MWEGGGWRSWFTLYFRSEEATESMQIPYPVVKQNSCAVKTFAPYGKLGGMGKINRRVQKYTMTVRV